jgi:hypothetical protein
MYRKYHDYYPVCSDSKCKEVRYNLTNNRKDVIFTCTACGNRTNHKVDSIPTEALRELLEDVVKYKEENLN